MTAYRWLAHSDEWQGRPAHAFVEGAERALCNRAMRPRTPVQKYLGEASAHLCQLCTYATERSVDLREVRE